MRKLCVSVYNRQSRLTFLKFSLKAPIKHPLKTSIISVFLSGYRGFKLLVTYTQDLIYVCQ